MCAQLNWQVLFNCLYFGVFIWVMCSAELMSQLKCTWYVCACFLMLWMVSNDIAYCRNIRLTFIISQRSMWMNEKWIKFLIIPPLLLDICFRLSYFSPFFNKIRYHSVKVMNIHMTFTEWKRVLLNIHDFQSMITIFCCWSSLVFFEISSSSLNIKNCSCFSLNDNDYSLKMKFSLKIITFIETLPFSLKLCHFYHFRWNSTISDENLSCWLDAQFFVHVIGYSRFVRQKWYGKSKIWRHFT